METKNTASSEGQPQAPQAPRRRSFYGTGKFKWAVYPDYWKSKWGEPPLLGHVYADNEFCAEREAYNRGLLTLNYTIRPKPVLIGPALPRTNRNYNNRGERQ
jgi:hypothetical protein